MDAEKAGKAPLMYVSYLLVVAFASTNWLLLRHPREFSEQYPLYYCEICSCVFNAFFVLALIALAKTLMTTPSSAEASYGSVEYCGLCETFVSKQSYHCGICNQCTLHVKTHCAWLCSCIGPRNYKVFLLYLLYVSIAGAVYCYLLVQYFWGGLAPDYLESVLAKVVIYSQCLVVTMMWVFAAHSLALHSILVINNVSLIDLNRGEKLAKIPCLCKDFIPNSDYDLGPLANIRNSLGSNVLCWLVPTDSLVWAQETEEMQAPEFRTSDK